MRRNVRVGSVSPWSRLCRQTLVAGIVYSSVLSVEPTECAGDSSFRQPRSLRTSNKQAQTLAGRALELEFGEKRCESSFAFATPVQVKFPVPLSTSSTCKFAPRRTLANKQQGLSSVRMQGVQGAWNRVRLDSKQRPRLTSAYEKVLGFIIRLSLGGRVDSLRVSVKGKSNREIARGNLQSLEVEFGQVKGPILQTQSGSLRGTNLALGYRPMIAVSYPILLILGLLPGLWLTLGAILMWTLSKPKSAIFGYRLGVTAADLMGCLVFRIALKLSLDTLIKSSVLAATVSAASGDLTGALTSATGFEVAGVAFDAQRRLVFDAQALLPEGAVFTFQLRSGLMAEREGLAFVNPEIFVSPGWPLPDFWLPVISGVILQLGKWNSLQQISAIQDGLDLKGSLLLGTDDLAAPDDGPDQGRRPWNPLLPPSK